MIVSTPSVVGCVFHRCARAGRSWDGSLLDQHLAFSGINLFFSVYFTHRSSVNPQLFLFTGEAGVHPSSHWQRGRNALHAGNQEVTRELHIKRPELTSNPLDVHHDHANAY